MSEAEHYQNLVLGSGEAGKYIAWTLAGKGERTAVVERQWIGGSCPNIACLPSKNVIHSAKVASLFTRAAEFGIDVRSFPVSMHGVRARKNEMVEALVRTHLANYEKSGAELIVGEGRLTGSRRMEVKLRDGGTRTLTADRVFLNVGTRAFIPDVPGLAEARPMTHVEFLELDHTPDHLAILGGGYIALELGQAMRRLGRRVTIVERGSQLARREDPDVGEALLELFRDEGIDVLLRAQLRKVSGTSGEEGVVLEIECEGGDLRRLEASHLLVATGRTPNTRDAGVREAGIALDDKGYIQVNERLETTAPGVWAMGECAGSPQSTHVSFDDFRVVRDNLQGGNRTTRDRLIPRCVFTDPELARVGLNESEARSRGIRYRAVKAQTRTALRTLTLSETRGFLKLLIEEDSNRILGFTAFATGGGELMAVVQTAMLSGSSFLLLRDAIYAHPTMAEGLMAMLADVDVK